LLVLLLLGLTLLQKQVASNKSSFLDTNRPASLPVNKMAVKGTRKAFLMALPASAPAASLAHVLQPAAVQAGVVAGCWVPALVCDLWPRRLGKQRLDVSAQWS